MVFFFRKKILFSQIRFVKIKPSTSVQLCDSTLAHLGNGNTLWVNEVILSTETCFSQCCNLKSPRLSYKNMDLVKVCWFRRHGLLTVTWYLEVLSQPLERSLQCLSCHDLVSCPKFHVLWPSAWNENSNIEIEGRHKHSSHINWK